MYQVLYLYLNYFILFQEFKNLNGKNNDVKMKYYLI